MIGLLTWQWPAFEVLNYIFPGYQLDLMAGQRAGVTLALGLPLLQTAVLLLAGERILQELIMTVLIQAQSLSKNYGAKRALDNVSFEINKGAPVALVGPNGAGKTTLFSLLCGYILPSSGKLSVMGHTPGSAALFGKLTALPQDAQLDPRFSIAHQLNFYGQLQGLDGAVRKKETARVLELVGLSKYLSSDRMTFLMVCVSE